MAYRRYVLMLLVSTAIVDCFNYDDGFRFGQIMITQSSIDITITSATITTGPIESMNMKIFNQALIASMSKCAMVSPTEFTCNAQKLEPCTNYKICIDYPFTYFMKRTVCRTATTTGCKKYIVTAETKLGEDDGFDLGTITATKTSIDIAGTLAISATRPTDSVNIKISDDVFEFSMSKCEMLTPTNFACNAKKLKPCSSYELCVTVQETLLMNKTKCRNVTTYGCNKDIVTSDMIFTNGFELDTASFTKSTIDISGSTVKVTNGKGSSINIEVFDEFSEVWKNKCEMFSPTKFKCSAKKLNPCTSYKTCITYQLTLSKKRTVCSTTTTTGCKNITITAYSKFDEDSGFDLHTMKITSTSIDIISKKTKNTMGSNNIINIKTYNQALEVSENTCDIFNPTEFKCSTKNLDPCTSYKICVTNQLTFFIKNTVCRTVKTTGCMRIIAVADSFQFGTDNYGYKNQIAIGLGAFGLIAAIAVGAVIWWKKPKRSSSLRTAKRCQYTNFDNEENISIENERSTLTTFKKC